MKNKLVYLIILTTILAGFTAGDIYYEIDASKEDIRMNSTIKMECDSMDKNCPVNTWTLKLNKPPNSTVEDVKSSLGEVNRYDVEDSEITIETRSEKPSESVNILVNYRIDQKAEKIGNGLFYHKIGLPGFQGERNYGEIRAEEMLHADISHGFKSSLQDDVFRFSGEGPANANLNFGQGFETDYYEFFGEQPERTEKAYEISAGILGFHHRYDKLPTVVFENKEYNRSVNEWSRGQYTRGRLLIREDLGDDFLPILAHETVHALNDEKLEWDKTDSSYFDEGTSKYVEALVRRTEIDNTNEPVREIFGEDVSYTEERDGRKYKITLPSKGEQNQLWQYYQEDLEFMKIWNAESENRAFGYAYSELITRNHIVNEDGSIRELYKQLDRQEKINSPREKWSYYSKYLDMTPCKYDSRDRFEECLNNINEYDYPIYTAQPAKRPSSSLDIDEINISEPEMNADGPETNSSQELDKEVFREGYNQSDGFEDENQTGEVQKTDDRSHSSGSLVDRIFGSINYWISYIFHV